MSGQSVNLAIDVGNTFCKWRLQGGQSDALLGKAQVVELMKAVDCDLSSWRDAKAVVDLFKTIEDVTIKKVDICSVADVKLNKLLVRVIKDIWQVNADLFEVSAERAGLINSYPQPEKMGPDRWLAAIAAHHLYPNKSLCIVDCGTAINVEFLSAQRHLGGYILPGISMMQRSLLENTALVKQASVDVSLALGKDTGSNVANGSLYIVVALIEKLQRDMQAKDGLVLITGGSSCFFKPYISAENVLYKPELIFDGFQFL